MKPASLVGHAGLFDADQFQRLKNSRELFNQTMARHLLGNMVTLFVERSAVTLDYLNEIGRMSLDDAKRFLSNSPLTNSKTLPVAHSFLKCADDAMVEQIFENTQKLALNYVSDCTHLAVDNGEDGKGVPNFSNS
jgi:hypothetical protein